MLENTRKAIERAAEDFEYARGALNAGTLDRQHIDRVAAAILLAARLEAIEDALHAGLPAQDDF